jgi:hypothetical protein
MRCKRCHLREPHVCVAIDPEARSGWAWDEEEESAGTLNSPEEKRRLEENRARHLARKRGAA